MLQQRSPVCALPNDRRPYFLFSHRAEHLPPAKAVLAARGQKRMDNRDRHDLQAPRLRLQLLAHQGTIVLAWRAQLFLVAADQLQITSNGRYIIVPTSYLVL